MVIYGQRYLVKLPVHSHIVLEKGWRQVPVQFNFGFMNIMCHDKTLPHQPLAFIKDMILEKPKVGAFCFDLRSFSVIQLLTCDFIFKH